MAVHPDVTEDDEKLSHDEDYYLDCTFENDTPDKEENPVSGEDDLVKVYLHRPEELFGYLTLSAPQGGSKIKVWESKTKETNDLITLPRTWNLSGENSPHTPIIS